MESGINRNYRGVSPRSYARNRFGKGQYSIGTNDGWDPLWDKRRSNTVASAPRGHVHDNKIAERVQKVDDGLAQQEELLKAHRKAEADRKPKSFLEKILASD